MPGWNNNARRSNTVGNRTRPPRTGWTAWQSLSFSNTTPRFETSVCCTSILLLSDYMYADFLKYIQPDQSKMGTTCSGEYGDCVLGPCFCLYDLTLKADIVCYGLCCSGAPPSVAKKVFVYVSKNNYYRICLQAFGGPSAVTEVQNNLTQSCCIFSRFFWHGLTLRGAPGIAYFEHQAWRSCVSRRTRCRSEISRWET